MTWRFGYPSVAGGLAFAAATAWIPNATAQAADTGSAAARPPATEKTASLPQAATSGNPLWAIPLKQLSNTRDRPIFSPTRRPPPPVAVDRPFVAPVVARVEHKPPERPGLALVGTVAGEGEGIALFMEQATQTIVRLRTGEDHQGWVLRSVRRREASLEKGDRTEVISLPDPGSEEASADPTPPPPPEQPAPRRQSRRER